VRQFYVSNNITFTWPTLKGGWRILVNSEEEPVNYWAFLDAFSWQLWLAIILTMFGVGFVIWFVERWALLGHKPRPGDAPLARLDRHVWRSLGRPMQVRCCACWLASGAIQYHAIPCFFAACSCSCQSLAAACRDVDMALLPMGRGTAVVAPRWRTRAAVCCACFACMLAAASCVCARVTEAASCCHLSLGLGSILEYPGTPNVSTWPCYRCRP
jgi:hypothetical protein